MCAKVLLFEAIAPSGGGGELEGRTPHAAKTIGAPCLIPLDARKARLSDVVEDVSTKTLRYLYDFGDGWDHTIKIERLHPSDPHTA